MGLGRRSVIGLRIVHPISREEILRVPFQLVVSRVRTKFRVAFHTPHTICNVTGKECHLISFSVAEKVIYMQGLHVYDFFCY